MKTLQELEIDFYKCPDLTSAKELVNQCQCEDVMLSIHDLQGNYMFVSGTCANLLGFAAEELVGTSAYDYFHSEDFQTILTTHAKVTIRPEVEHVDYRLKTASGNYLKVYTLSRQFKSEGGLDMILAFTVKRR